MNIQEFETLKKVLTVKDVPPLINVGDLKDASDRTLLYGYDTDSNTYHTYIKQGLIFTVVYSPVTEIALKDVTSDEERIPNKRLYPERCDAEFCTILHQKGFHLSFTTYDEKRATAFVDGIYFGKTLP